LKVLAVLELPLTQEQDGYEKKIDLIVAVSEEDRAKQQAADEAQAAKITARRTLHNTAKVTCHYRVYLRNTFLRPGI
jgi:hypothetical protein